ncbi:MAG: hypothetical protein M1358_07810 [Chloroflexi bacterium]|nr:hypothetical protein [Chloroflexota bacterium]
MKRKTWEQGWVVDIALSLELVLGVASGLMGIVALVLATFGPIMRRESAPPPILYVTGADARWLPSLAAAGLSSITTVFLVVMLLSSVGIAIGAYVHGWRRARSGLVLLWLCSAIFSVGLMICDLSIAAYLLAAGPKAVVAAIVGSFAELWAVTARNSRDGEQ